MSDGKHPDIADLIAGAHGVSRGTAYEWMREALRDTVDDGAVPAVPAEPLQNLRYIYARAMGAAGVSDEQFVQIKAEVDAALAAQQEADTKPGRYPPHNHGQPYVNARQGIASYTYWKGDSLTPAASWTEGGAAPAVPAAPGMAAQALAAEIIGALLADEKDGGYDLTAGMFGAAFSALVRRWAALEYAAAQQGVAS